MEEKKNKIDERDIFLRGEYLLLKVLTEDDVINSNWYGWFNDEKTTKHMTKHYYPNSCELQLDFLRGLKSNINKIQLGIIPKGEIEIKGVISLQNIDYINRNAEIAIIIGDREFRNLKYAEEAIKLMLNHGFFTLNLHKIYSGHIESLISWGDFLTNTFGFKKEGIWREHVYKNGKYVDVYRIGIIKKNYERFQHE